MSCYGWVHSQSTPQFRMVGKWNGIATCMAFGGIYRTHLYDLSMPVPCCILGIFDHSPDRVVLGGWPCECQC
eukprot:6588676-Karenia_brevis.AAC.1